VPAQRTTKGPSFHEFRSQEEAADSHSADSQEIRARKGDAPLTAFPTYWGANGPMLVVAWTARASFSRTENQCFMLFRISVDMPVVLTKSKRGAEGCGKSVGAPTGCSSYIRKSPVDLMAVAAASEKTSIRAERGWNADAGSCGPFPAISAAICALLSKEVLEAAIEKDGRFGSEVRNQERDWRRRPWRGGGQILLPVPQRAQRDISACTSSQDGQDRVCKKMRRIAHG
jgi:hypothetical protein